MNGETIMQGIRFLSKAYPGKITSCRETEQVWARLLGDLSDQSFLAAIEHYAATKPIYPPTPAEIRQKAIELDHGMITEITAMQAWDRIWRSFNDTEIVLTDIEREVLRFMGGSWALRNSRNLTTDRAHFLRAYDETLNRRKVERQTTPRIRAFVGANQKLLRETNE